VKRNKNVCPRRFIWNISAATYFYLLLNKSAFKISIKILSVDQSLKKRWQITYARIQSFSLFLYQRYKENEKYVSDMDLSRDI